MKKEEKIEVCKTILEGNKDFRVIQLYEFAISNEKELYPYVQKGSALESQIAAYRRVINHYGFPLKARWSGEKIIVERGLIPVKVDPLKLAKKIIDKMSEPTQKLCRFVVCQKVDFAMVEHCTKSNEAGGKYRAYDRAIKKYCLEKYVMLETKHKNIYLIRKANENELG